MEFSFFADQLLELEATSSRLVMTEKLASLFKQLDPSEVAAVCYLLQGQLRPSYEALEYGVAVKTITKALAQLSVSDVEVATDLFGDSATLAGLTARYKVSGDLGEVAAEVINSREQVVSKDSVLSIYQTLVVLAQESGVGSQDRKLQHVAALLGRVSPAAAKLIVRLVLGKLRLGFSTMTMIDALSWSQVGSKAESVLIEAAYQRRADIGYLATVYLPVEDFDQRIAALANITVKVGTPIVPALCQRLNSSAEIISKMKSVYVEPKYDGLRLQIHVWREAGEVKVRIFTRNLENATEMFPEVVTGAESLNCNSCILDGEAITYDRDTGQLRSFQETITRKRKHGVAETAAALPIRCYVFDVLAIDDTSLIESTLEARKQKLTEVLTDGEVFQQTPFIVTSDPQELQAFHEEQLAQGLEGAVIKQLTSVYQSGRKGWSWVKIKEAEGTRGKLKDTLDCIVLGYYAGRGKRTQFGLGAFLVGVLSDDQASVVKTIAKIGTGISDEQFRELYERCQVLTVPQPPQLYDVPKALVPDVWLDPSLVVEIAADELTTSPLHSAGVALRFPRLVRFRDDKNWQQATTVEELASLS